jgi:hypothetical protein
MDNVLLGTLTFDNVITVHLQLRRALRIRLEVHLAHHITRIQPYLLRGAFPILEGFVCFSNLYLRK